MRACILNRQTQIVENVIVLDTLDPAVFIPYKEGIELAPRHDGEIGWTLLPNGEWQIPNTELTLEEKTIKARSKRNNLLKQSDVYMLSDFPMTEEKRQECLAYRQALRDLPSQIGFPLNINWPIKPI